MKKNYKWKGKVEKREITNTHWCHLLSADVMYWSSFHFSFLLFLNIFFTFYLKFWKSKLIKIKSFKLTLQTFCTFFSPLSVISFVFKNPFLFKVENDSLLWSTERRESLSYQFFSSCFSLLIFKFKHLVDEFKSVLLHWRTVCSSHW